MGQDIVSHRGVARYPGHDILSLVYLNGGAILRTVRSVLAVAILAGGVAKIQIACSGARYGRPES